MCQETVKCLLLCFIQRSKDDWTATKSKARVQKNTVIGLWRCGDENNVEEELNDADANGVEMMMMMMMGMHVGRGGGGAVGRLPCKTR